MYVGILKVAVIVYQWKHMDICKYSKGSCDSVTMKTYGCNVCKYSKRSCDSVSKKTFGCM